jgi:selenocysteine-specific elongation factor
LKLAQHRLARLLRADKGTVCALFVEMAGERGLRRAEIAARTGWTNEALEEAAKSAVKSGAVLEADGVYISKSSFERLSETTLAEINAHHKREPLSRGLPRETLRERVFSHAAPEVFRFVLMRMEAAGALHSEKEIVRGASHKLALSSEDVALRDRLENLYRSAALEPPTLTEALERAGGASAREHERKIFQLLLDARLLVRVTPDLYFHSEALELLTAKLREYGAGHAPERLIDVPTFKEIAGVTRKYAIPLLEHLDRERITRRAGDKRVIL